MALQSTVLTCIAAVAQIVALVYFIVSYVPGGQTGNIVSYVPGGQTGNIVIQTK